MKRAIVLLACALAGVGHGAVNVKAVVTGPDKKTIREIPLNVVCEADGALRATVKAVDVKDAWLVDIQADCAVAKKGEDGFWLGGRGILGSFKRGVGGWACARNWNTLPYFAMQTPRGSFIAILEGMRFETEERLSVVDGVYRMYARWRVGETGIGPYEDMHLLIYELPKGSDYNAMAKTYRRYKLARAPEMKTTKEKIKERPHLAKLARAVAVRQQCASKPFRRPEDAIDFTPETEHPVRCNKSFDDTLKLLQKMKAMGIDDVAMCLAGWQTGGYDGRAPAVFPVEPVAGGEEGLRRLITGGQALGYIIDAQDNYSDCYTCSPLWDNGNIACVGPTGKLETNGSWCGGRAYNLCLKNAWDVQGFMQDNLRRTAALGFYGCHYIDVFTAAYPYRCLNPKHAANRNEQMQFQIAAATYCRKTFGGFSSECCFDHLLPYVDYINYATAAIRGHRRTIAEGKTPTPEKFVPFFELAFHDYVLSNPDKVTQEVLKQPENLILVEFGGRPIFYHVGEDNIPGIKKAYDQFVGLRHLQLEEMVEHKELQSGLIRVKYGNGEAIYVNHTDKPQSADGITIPAIDFLLKRP